MWKLQNKVYAFISAGESNSAAAGGNNIDEDSERWMSSGAGGCESMTAAVILMFSGRPAAKPPATVHLEFSHVHRRYDPTTMSRTQTTRKTHAEEADRFVCFYLFLCRC